MTENTQTAASTNVEADADDVAEMSENSDIETDADNGQNPNAEAAKYRVRARAAEAELATANARLEQLLRADVERIASATLSHPSDLFSLSGNGLADYLDESGSIDAEKVAADVAAILAERPGLRRLSAATDPSQGLGGNPGKSAPSWTTFLKD